MCGLKKVEHWHLLDGKSVMDDAVPMLQRLKALIPEKLHDDYDAVIETFEHDLAECDVSDRYVEKT